VNQLINPIGCNIFIPEGKPYRVFDPQSQQESDRRNEYLGIPTVIAEIAREAVEMAKETKKLRKGKAAVRIIKQAHKLGETPAGEHVMS
jgi:hypothetical protein